MKRTLSIILSIIMAASLLSACGNDEQTATPDEASPDTAVIATAESASEVEDTTIVTDKDDVKQVVVNEGLKVNEDGTVTDADGTKLEVKDGKITVTTESGEKIEVAVDDIKAANTSSSDKSTASSSSSKSSTNTSSKSTSSSAKSSGSTGGSTNTNTGTNTGTNTNNNAANNSGNAGGGSGSTTNSSASNNTGNSNNNSQPTPKPTQAPTQPPKTTYTFDVDYFYSQTVAYAKSKGMMLDTSLTLDNAAWRNPDVLIKWAVDNYSTEYWISNSGYSCIDAVINEGLSEGYLPTDTYFNVIIHQLHEGVYYQELGRTATAQEDGGYSITIPYC